MVHLTPTNVVLERRDYQAMRMQGRFLLRLFPTLQLAGAGHLDPLQLTQGEKTSLVRTTGPEVIGGAVGIMLHQLAELPQAGLPIELELPRQDLHLHGTVKAVVAEDPAWQLGERDPHTIVDEPPVWVWVDGEVYRREALEPIECLHFDGHVTLTAHEVASVTGALGTCKGPDPVTGYEARLQKWRQAWYRNGEPTGRLLEINELLGDLLDLPVELWLQQQGKLDVREARDRAERISKAARLSSCRPPRQVKDARILQRRGGGRLEWRWIQ